MLFMKNLIILSTILLLSASLFSQEELPKKQREWPSEISSENQKELFLNLYKNLAVLKNKKEKVSFALIDGKLIRGSVLELAEDACTLLDYKNISYIIPFKKIKALYILKILPLDKQNGTILYSLGMLFYYEKDWEKAENCFQKSAAKGYQPSLEWVKKSQEERNLVLKQSQEKKEAEEEAQKEVAEKKAEEKAQKEAKKAIPTYEKMVYIQGGNELNIASHLVPQKYTIFQFTATWCGPCRMISPQIEAMVNKNESLYLRKVDIINWKSPVSKQFKLRSIPYFIIYNPEGKVEKQGGTQILKDMMQK